MYDLQLECVSDNKRINLLLKITMGVSQLRIQSLHKESADFFKQTSSEALRYKMTHKCLQFVFLGEKDSFTLQLSVSIQLLVGLDLNLLDKNFNMLFYGAIIKSYSKSPCYEYDFNTSVLRRRFYTGVFKQLAVIHAVIRYVLGVINKQVTRFNIIGAFHSMIKSHSV